MDTDAIVEGLQTMQSAGYRNEDDTALIAFAHPESVKHLYSDMDFITDVDKNTIHGVPVKTTPELPDNTVLLAHSEAIAPNLPSVQSFKPWSVKDPSGVVLLQPNTQQ